MGKAVSRGQALQVAARVATQVDWDKLDGDRLQRGIIDLSPEEFSSRLTRFFQNNGNFIVDEIRPIMARSFNPAEFIGKGWTVWKGPVDCKGLKGEEDQNESSLVLSEISISSLSFETCLNEGEKSIIGEEKCRRLKAKASFICLDARFFFGLWGDYQANRENSILEMLYRTCGIEYLDFFGTILRGPRGGRCVLCLCRGGGGEWGWGCHWLDDDWDAVGLSAGCASS